MVDMYINRVNKRLDTIFLSFTHYKSYIHLLTSQRLIRISQSKFYQIFVILFLLQTVKNDDRNIVFTPEIDF